MNKKLIMTVAAALAVPFSAVVIAAPASAAPACDAFHPARMGDPTCENCVKAHPNTADQIVACMGGPSIVVPVPGGSTGYADCDAMVSANDRANCWDEHLLGQR
jgi:hypothetical protein